MRTKQNKNVQQSYIASWAEWYKCFGHISIHGLQKLHAKNLVDGFDVDPDSAITDCDTCRQAKLTRNAQPKISAPHNTVPGDIIHTDVWGPAPVHTINGAQYFITFIDDASRYTAIAFMASKDETTSKIQYYLAHIKRQYSYKPKAIHADNGREYVNKTLKEWCLKHGIDMQTTAPYSPAQNGIAERTNRTITELMRAMLLARSLPNLLWNEAAYHAVYLRNRAYTRTLPNITPYEKWTKHKPNIAHLREFGCDVWVLREPQTQSKLEARSFRAIFVGYEDGPKAIKYYVPTSRQIKITRNYQFTHSPNQIHSPPSEITDIENTQNTETLTTTNTPDIRKSKRRKKNIDYDLLNDPWRDQDPSETLQTHVALNCHGMDLDTTIDAEPQSLSEARESSEWHQWQRATHEEMMQLQKQNTWQLTNLPIGRKPITNKWVFVKKYDTNGKIIKYKARLVARGFSQIPGTDFTATFAPVVRLETICTLLALAVNHNWEIQQMDVKGAYLNGILKEDVYMTQPEGFEDGTSRVCKLIKTIYGLKQSGREWNAELNSRLEQ